MGGRDRDSVFSLVDHLYFPNLVGFPCRPQSPVAKWLLGVLAARQHQGGARMGEAPGVPRSAVQGAGHPSVTSGSAADHLGGLLAHTGP